MTGTSEASLGANSFRLNAFESLIDDALSGLNKTGESIELFEEDAEEFGIEREESVCGERWPDWPPT